MITFGLLGPLEVTVDDRTIAVPGGRRAALLARLLIDAERVVSTNRVIDDLWEEGAPPAAAKTVQAHVSHLRRLLGDGVIETRGRGYAIRLHECTLDTREFERLVERARHVLPVEAAATLREALGLWRGPALADFAGEGFAEPEIKRLEELRLTAREDRIEADLALGQHAVLVAELEALTHVHRSRERLWGALMLALYRCGRQADALAAYQTYRRALADEVGLVPGVEVQRLEGAILRQDPTLAAPAHPLLPRHGWSGTRRLAVLAVVATAALAGTVVLATTSGAHPPAEVPVRANSLVELDVQTGRVVADVKLSSQPGQVVSGGRRVWVAEEQTDTVVRVDPGTLKSTPEGIAIDPAALAYGDGSLWAYDPVDERAIRLDPDLNQDELPTPFQIPPCHRSLARPVRCLQGGIAVADGSVWVGRALNAPDSLGVVWQFNPRHAIPTLTRTIRNVPGAEIVSGGGAIWTASPDRASQIEPSTGKVLERWEVPGGVLTGTNYEEPFGMTWADHFTWIVVENDALAQLGFDGTNTTRFVGGIPLGPGAADVAAGGGYLWVTNDAGTVAQIDLNSLKIVRTYRLHHPAYGIAYTHNSIWVGVS